MASSKRAVCGILVMVLAAAVSSEQFIHCDNEPMRAFYQDIGCVPADEGPCPKRYDCDKAIADVRQVKGGCRYRGKTIKVGDLVKTENPCQQGCICIGGDNGFGRIACPIVDCFFPNLPSGCFPKYTPESCCPIGSICPAEEKNLAKCEYNGETSYEGMSFRPNDFPCVTCDCKKGFNGTIAEPFCKLTHHDYMLDSSEELAKGCIPVFISSVCYASQWRCPNQDDRVVSTAVTPNSVSQGKCQFGKHQMNVGDELSGDDYKCSCITPPLVTCTK